MSVMANTAAVSSCVLTWALVVLIWMCCSSRHHTALPTSDPDDNLRGLLVAEDTGLHPSARRSSSSGQLQLARDS
jgi:hypothetical protein